MMETEQLKDLVITALEDVKAQDIHVMDVSEMTSITDYMIVASGTSDRQVRALANNILDECKKHDIEPIGMEGQEKGEWILVDLADVIVHVMQASARDFYQLEKLWTITEERSEKSRQS